MTIIEAIELAISKLDQSFNETGANKAQSIISAINLLRNCVASINNAAQEEQKPAEEEPEISISELEGPFPAQEA